LKVGIVLPWRETPERIDGFEAALRWHKEIFPDFTFYKSDSVGEKFNPSEARNRGCLEAIADGCDVLVVLDADTLFHRLGIIEAIEAAIKTQLVCYPYTYVVDLSADETVQYLSGRINLELFTEKVRTPSTYLRASTITNLSSKSMNRLPFLRSHHSSEFSPTIRTSPIAFAAWK